MIFMIAMLIPLISRKKASAAARDGFRGDEGGHWWLLNKKKHLDKCVTGTWSETLQLPSETKTSSDDVKYIIYKLKWRFST